MSELLRNYLFSLTACALLSGLVLQLVPKGAVRNVCVFCCGLVLVLVTVQPILRLDPDALAQSVSRLEMEAEQARTGVTVKSRELTGEIIKENCAAYILDKAAEIGLALRVEVGLGGEQTYPYPASVILYADPTPAQKTAMEQYLIRNFAISKERQTWITESDPNGSDSSDPSGRR